MTELFDSLAGRTPFTYIMQYLIAFCSRPEVTSGVLSCRFVKPIVLDECVEFRDSRLNRYREFPPVAIGGGIFDRFFSQSLTTGSGVTVEWIGIDVRVKN